MSYPITGAVTLAAMLALGGCANTTNQDAGAVIGAVAGGVLGSQVGRGSGKTAATIAGTLVGAYLGGYLGRQMDENDRYRMNDALERTPTNERSSWRNPDTGYDYAVTPVRTYQASRGPCREYVTEAWIDGRREEMRGTACRSSDGTWRADNS